MDLKNKLRLGRSVLRYRLTGKPTPVAVAWLITGRCNLDCRYCHWRGERETDEMDTAAVRDMIGEMAKAGVLLISFTGGEPLVREDIGEIIGYVKALGLTCKLNSNGILVEKRIRDLAPLDLLQISVDGPPDVQDNLRGQGSSQAAAQAIASAREAGIKVQLIACLTRENVERLDEVLDYGLRLGVGFCFQILNGKNLPGEATAEALPDREKLTEALHHLLRLKREGDPRARAIASKASELRHYLDLFEGKRSGCECTLATVTMLPDGRLIFCGHAKEQESFDARSLGFAEAFSRLKIPDCDGCVCVGKLRLSQVYKFDPALIREMLGL